MTKNRRNDRKSSNGAAVLAVFAALVVWTLAPVAAQTGATVYGGNNLAGTPASLQYGSLGSGINIGNNTSSSLNAFSPVSGHQTSRPVLVAQTPQPAQVNVPQPVVSTPTVTQPSVVVTQPILSAPALLQPMDPYATPNQSSLFQINPVGSPIFSSGSPSNRPYGQNNTTSGIYSGNFDRFIPETYDAMRRFREATSFEYTFLPGGSKSNSFGMNEIEARLQLAFPCRFIPNNGAGRGGQGFFYVAPGGGLVWWDGPIGPPDMSANGFKAFLDVGVQPQFTDVFGMNAWFRFGVFSDFKDVGSDAIRCQGRVEGIFNVSKELQIYAGVIYMDRARVKMMPTGGVVWTPRDDLVLKLIFPNPKISKRLWTRPNAEWWGYVHADYGGDSWDIRGLGKTDYNDIRVGVGLEFETLSRVGGYFEFGGSFGRELYSRHQKWASPPDVFYFKTGFIF